MDLGRKAAGRAGDCGSGDAGVVAKTKKGFSLHRAALARHMGMNGRDLFGEWKSEAS